MKAGVCAFGRRLLRSSQIAPFHVSGSRPQPPHYSKLLRTPEKFMLAFKEIFPLSYLSRRLIVTISVSLRLASFQILSRLLTPLRFPCQKLASPTTSDRHSLYLLAEIPSKNSGKNRGSKSRSFNDLNALASLQSLFFTPK